MVLQKNFTRSRNSLLVREEFHIITDTAFCEKNQKTQEYLQFREGIHSEEAGTHTIRTG